MKKSKLYGICAVVIMIDQCLKLLVQMNVKPVTQVKIIPGFFSLLYVENKGAAFGLLKGATLPLILVSVVAFFAIFKYLEKEKNISSLSGWAYGLLLGGLVGNLVDRLFYGIVRDFFSFTIFGYDFPVFNIADIAIVIGVGFFIIDVIRSEIHEYRNNSRRKRK